MPKSIKFGKYIEQKYNANVYGNNGCHINVKARSVVGEFPIFHMWQLEEMFSIDCRQS